MTRHMRFLAVALAALPISGVALAESKVIEGKLALQPVVTAQDPCNPCPPPCPPDFPEVCMPACKIAKCRPAPIAACPTPKIVIHQSEPTVEFRTAPPARRSISDANVARCGGHGCGHGNGGGPAEGCNACCGTTNIFKVRRNQLVGSGLPVGAGAMGMPQFLPTTVTAMATVPIQVPAYSLASYSMAGYGFGGAAYGAGLGTSSAMSLDDASIRALANALSAAQSRPAAQAQPQAQAQSIDPALIQRIDAIDKRLSSLEEKIKRITDCLAK